MGEKDTFQLASKKNEERKLTFVLSEKVWKGLHLTPPIQWNCWDLSLKKTRLPLPPKEAEAEKPGAPQRREKASLKNK